MEHVQFPSVSTPGLSGETRYGVRVERTVRGVMWEGGGREKWN